MNNPALRLSEQLAQLRLSFLQENHQTFADQGAREQWTHLQYLGRLLEGETQRRQDRCIARRIAAARFPVIKTLDQFNWNWPEPKAGVLTATTITGLGMNSVPMSIYQVQSSQDLIHWTVRSTVSSSQPEVSCDDFGEVKPMTFYRIVELIPGGKNVVIPGLKIALTSTGAHLVWSNSPSSSPRTPAEDISYTGFDSVSVNLGNFGNAFAVASTNAGTTTSVNGGSSSDTINVWATGGRTFVNTGAGDDEVTVGSRSRSLDAILGSLFVKGQTHGADDTLNIIDSSRPEPGDYTLTGKTFARKDLPTIDYESIEKLNIVLGTGPNHRDVHDLNAATLTTTKGMVADSRVDIPPHPVVLA